MADRLKSRALEQQADFFITVITMQEVTQGWLAHINGQKSGRGQIYGYRSMDLKIAAICLSHDALLLSHNLVDFNKVPGLRVENWLD